MNTLDAFFQWLLAASLRASLLALAVLALQFILRRWLPARWRHALWLPVLVVLIAPQLPASRWSMQNHLGKPAVLVRTTLAPANDPATPAEPPGAADPWSAPSAPATAYPGGRTVVLLVWLPGACGVLGLGMAGYGRSLRRIRREAVATVAAIAETTADVAQQLRLRRCPQIIVSTAVASPAVAGLLRPMLLLPAGFPAGFSAAEARLILLHELTHLKRGDLPLNWLLCLLQALHWFNPLLWLAFARMRSDRELACDAQVLAAEADDRRADYGNALLKLQSTAPRPGLSLAFVGIFERSAELRARIRAIAGYRRTHGAWSIATMAAVTLLTVIGATRAQTADPQPPPPAPAIVEATADFAVGRALKAATTVTPEDSPSGHWVKLGQVLEVTNAAASEKAVIEKKPAVEARMTNSQIEITAHFAEVDPGSWKAMRGAGTWTDVRGKQEWSWLIASTNREQQQRLVGKWVRSMPVDSLGASAVTLARTAQHPSGSGDKAGDFMSLVLKTLFQKKGVDMLALPKVTMRSRQRATIEVVREFRYPTAWEPGTKKDDKWTPTKFTMKNTGVTLTATPTVTNDGKISLWFEPLVTEFMGFTDLGHGRQKPIFSERRAQTTVTLRTGQTVVLGGCVRNDTQMIEDKVPVLGDIPLLGGLFRSSVTQKLQRYLVVFVTPRVVGEK